MSRKARGWDSAGVVRAAGLAASAIAVGAAYAARRHARQSVGDTAVPALTAADHPANGHKPAQTSGAAPQPTEDGTDIHLQYVVTPRVRFGETWNLARHRELHDVVAANSDRYHTYLEWFRGEVPNLRRIPVRGGDERTPTWENGYVPGLDTAALYTLPVRRNSALYVEVGSGNSTRWVRRTIEDHGLGTRLVSLDPMPRAKCDELCDEMIRASLEDADLTLFSRLGAGDICFLDGSHYAFQNSDVSVFFLEVLPRIPPGVLVGIHDIFLPDDYAPGWTHRWYNEQYMLAAYLLGGGGRMSIEFPSWYVSHDPAFSDELRELWDQPEFAGILNRHGNAFWMETR